jgi:hypothetical protein
VNTAFQIIPADRLEAAHAGAGLPSWLSNVAVDVKADVNKLVDSVGHGAQRLIGCGFGANSRQEFGRCVLTGKLDSQR